jgi:hypothetical protein
MSTKFISVIPYPSSEFNITPFEYRKYNVEFNSELFNTLCNLCEGWPTLKNIEDIYITEVDKDKYDGEMIYEKDKYRKFKYINGNDNPLYNNILLEKCSEALATFLKDFSSENLSEYELHIIINDSEAFKRDLETRQPSCRCGCGNTRGGGCNNFK